MKSPRAVALDLGSTRFKLGLLAHNGQLADVYSVPAPGLTGSGLIREGRSGEFLDVAAGLIDQLPFELDNIPLGLVCQRSTFGIWDSAGKTLTPMVSWQDRRAADWCTAHPELNTVIENRAGLLLSPHYVGPKLAAMQDKDQELSLKLRDDDAMFGNLDSWLIWNWTRDRIHQTDLTMAARTALVDIATCNWSPELIDLFDVPRRILPNIVETDQVGLRLEQGLILNASVADQAASALAVLNTDEDAALVNFGTAAFVLYPGQRPSTRKAGYLTAPIFHAGSGRSRFVLEGTINGAGPAVDRFGPGPTDLPVDDPCPDGFAIPDQTGLGSPHWRADFTLTLSPDAKQLSDCGRRRVVLEGLLFRVLEILTDLGGGKLPKRLLISGGLAKDPAIALGLASLLAQPVELLEEPETTLLGAARLAAGLDPYADPDTRIVEPTAAGAYLDAKYRRWQNWLAGLLAKN